MPIGAYCSVEAPFVQCNDESFGAPFFGGGRYPKISSSFSTAGRYTSCASFIEIRLEV